MLENPDDAFYFTGWADFEPLAEVRRPRPGERMHTITEVNADRGYIAIAYGVCCAHEWPLQPCERA